MTVFIVNEVNYDEHRIGRIWQRRIAATKELAEKVLKDYTRPVQYKDGPRPFVPHIHREGRRILQGYRSESTFVYMEEVAVLS